MAVEKVDVVYPLGSGSRWGDNEELRFSLRALQKNFLDLGRVVVVGERPSWLSEEAIHVPAADRYPGQTDANIIDKLLLACRRPLTRFFVRSSDDEAFVSPTRFADMRAYFHGELRAARFAPASRWHRRLRNTGRYLRARNRPARFFDCHAPVPMRRAQFIEVMVRAPYQRGSGLAVDSLYFNSDRKAPTARLQGQVLRLQVPVAASSELEALLSSARFLNYRDPALDPVLKRFLAEMFDRPSRFET